MTDPNRCPFCGMQSVVLREEARAVGQPNEEVSCWVACDYCDARGPRVKGARATERAVMLWNKAVPKEKP